MKSAPRETSHYAFPDGEAKKEPDRPPESDQTQAVKSIESYLTDNTNRPDSVEALVKRMTDAEPDSSYLQELQIAAGSPQKLEECLQWMVEQSKYSFGFDPEMPHLLIAEVSCLCHGKDSEVFRLTGKFANPLRR